jgi:hypothetical protein
MDQMTFFVLLTTAMSVLEKITAMQPLWISEQCVLGARTGSKVLTSRHANSGQIMRASAGFTQDDVRIAGTLIPLGFSTHTS